MDFARWEPHYRAILEEFGFDRHEDEEAARLLDRLLPRDRSSPEDLRPRLARRTVSVLGHGPDLEAQLDEVEGVVVAADEAVSVAMEGGLSVTAVVSDLDGRLDDLRAAQAAGATLVVHAHGDNRPALRRWVPTFGNRILGTTQARPFPGVHNFGGFTDGDRAAFLADHLDAGTIRLVGFDFERPHPKDRDPAVKRRKLAWARRLLQDLARRRPVIGPSFASSG